MWCLKGYRTYSIKQGRREEVWAQRVAAQQYLCQVMGDGPSVFGLRASEAFGNGSTV